MNRIVTALLCLLFFFNGALAQLVKLPQLFAHFQEHKQNDPRLDLSDFMAMHYIVGDNDNADNERDNELPFKKYEDSSNFDVEVIVAKPRISVILNNKSETIRKDRFSYLSGDPKSFVETELRPPVAY